MSVLSNRPAVIWYALPQQLLRYFVEYFLEALPQELAHEMSFTPGELMNANKPVITNRAVASMLMIAAVFISTQATANDLVCTGPQMGEIYINTQTGKVTKSAEESLTVIVATENTHYGFVFKGKISQFKATINRANGQIILDDACTPQCWGGPIFGNCTSVKAKF